MAVNAEPDTFKQEYVEKFIKLLLTENVTSSYNLGLVVCTIEQSLYDSEYSGADNENTRKFNHILFGESASD